MSNKTDKSWSLIRVGLYTRMINGYDMKIAHVDDDWEILGWNTEHHGYVLLGIAHGMIEAKRVAETFAQLEDPAMQRKPEPKHEYVQSKVFVY